MTQPTAFEDNALWEEYGRTEDYLERIDTIQGMLPEDISTLLDVGCGRGDVINALQKNNSRLRAMGMDPFSEALEFVETPSVIASLPDTPFPDKSFDMVLCLEVLEHIDESKYQPSLMELQRVAGRYLIIGVPFKENLMHKQAICFDCRKVSHADDHLRSFDEESAAGLFDHFVLEQKTLVGVMQRREPAIASWLRHNVSGVYYPADTFYCPYCACNVARNIQFQSPFLLRKLTSLLVRMLRRMKPLEPYWWIGLYRRQNV